MACHCIRGAISVDENSERSILNAAHKLLEEIISQNDTSLEDIAGVFFTATSDLDAVYPARAARDMGMTHVPLLCSQEMAVAGSLQRCMRVMVFWNTDKKQSEIKHIYLGEARSLRPDITKGNGQ